MAAGDKEIVQASEEVQRRNIIAMRQEISQMKAAMGDMIKIVDANQNNLMNYKTELDELRKQLALLQQNFYAAGTPSHGDQR